MLASCDFDTALGRSAPNLVPDAVKLTAVKLLKELSLSETRSADK
jgi:hypothetical protein